MAKEADRLNRVVSELLELVKPTHLALQAVDLNTLINHSLQLVSQDANSREIQLRFTANDTLPEIQADPDRLTQVLLNLYLNAIQAIGQHGVISVTASESGTGVKISVTDSGKELRQISLKPSSPRTSPPKPKAPDWGWRSCIILLNNTVVQFRSQARRKRRNVHPLASGQYYA